MNNEDVAFEEEPTVTAVPTAIPTEPPAKSKQVDPLRNFVWAGYGYSKDRRRYLPASKLLRPPFKRVWTYPGSILMEFSPAMAEGKLFLLRNNGALHAVDKRTGKAVWKKKIGVLAASTPAYGNGRIFATVLSRGKARRVPSSRSTPRPARSCGSACWRPARSPRRCSTATASTSAPRTARSTTCAPADGAVRWTFKASGSVKAGLALANGKLFFGDYKGRVYAIRQTDGKQIWSSTTRGARFGLGSGQFYSTPAVAYGRVYVGNTDGRMYSFSSSNGKLALDQGHRVLRVLLARGRAAPRREADRLLRQLRRLLLRRRRAQRQAAVAPQDGGKISGAPTVVGDVVYYSNWGKKSTTGLGVRTGQARSSRWAAARSSPVISDGRTIFLTGYSSLYARSGRRELAAIGRVANPAPLSACLTSGIVCVP